MFFYVGEFFEAKRKYQFFFATLHSTNNDPNVVDTKFDVAKREVHKPTSTTPYFCDTYASLLRS